MSTERSLRERESYSLVWETDGDIVGITDGR
jgi:hypothetical protein